MGALTRLVFGNTEQRMLDVGNVPGAFLRALRMDAGEPTTPTTAMQIAAVYACVRVIATNLATLPLVLMEHRGTLRAPATEHPLYGLLHWLPNPEMTSSQFRMALGVHLALYGNAYAQVVRDGGGRVRELWPLRPDRMRSERDDAGRLRYVYTGASTVTLDAAEVMHITHLSMDGQTGLSPIAMARRTFDTKARMEEYGAAFWQNDASPGVVLRYPGMLNPEKLSALRKAWDDRHRGPGAAGRTSVLDGGVEISTLSIPQTDAQFLESQKFSRQEIAALFGVPAHMINDLDRATFSNIEEMAQEFVDYTLMPYLTGWQQAIHRDLLTEAERPRYYAHFRTQALLRGNHASRAQFYQALQQVGAMSPNDIRSLEDLNPIPDGDLYLVPLNMTPVQDAGKKAADEPQRAQNPDRENPDREGGASGERRAASNDELRMTNDELVDAWLADARQRLHNRIANDVRQAGAKALRLGGRQALGEWGETMQREWRLAGETMLDALRSAHPIAPPAVGDWVAAAYQRAVQQLIATQEPNRHAD